MSIKACQRIVKIGKFCYIIEIGDADVNIVRNFIPMRNYMPKERLRSESHFRLVFQYHSVWKFQDLFVIQILREINFGESRRSKLLFLNFRGFGKFQFQKIPKNLN